jgi:hypothetical protein
MRDLRPLAHPLEIRPTILAGVFKLGAQLQTVQSALLQTPELFPRLGRFIVDEISVSSQQQR